MLWLTDNRANFSSMDFYVKAEAFFVDKLVFDVAIGIFLHIVRSVRTHDDWPR